MAIGKNYNAKDYTQVKFCKIRCENMKKLRPEEKKHIEKDIFYLRIYFRLSVYIPHVFLLEAHYEHAHLNQKSLPAGDTAARDSVLSPDFRYNNNSISFELPTPENANSFARCIRKKHQDEVAISKPNKIYK